MTILMFIVRGITLKCKICGHRTNSLQAMLKHYKKKHPNSLKRHARKRARKGGYNPLFRTNREQLEHLRGVKDDLVELSKKVEDFERFMERL